MKETVSGEAGRGLETVLFTISFPVTCTWKQTREATSAKCHITTIVIFIRPTSHARIKSKATDRRHSMCGEWWNVNTVAVLSKICQIHQLWLYSHSQPRLLDDVRR